MGIPARILALLRIYGKRDASFSRLGPYKRQNARQERLVRASGLAFIYLCAAQGTSNVQPYLQQSFLRVHCDDKEKIYNQKRTGWQELF